MFARRGKETKITTLLGKDAVLDGSLTTEGSVRIDGVIRGNVTITGSLIIGESGRVEGNVIAKDAVIGGEVLGNVTAPEKTELVAAARVLGDIATNLIVIDEHAVFHGKCIMNKEELVEEEKGKVLVEEEKEELEKVDGKEKPLEKDTHKPARTKKKSAKAALAEALREVKEAEMEQSEQDS